MASKKENIKALFSNTRTRVIILFTVVLLVFAIVFGFLRLSQSIAPGSEATANVGNVPGGIQSIPGSLNPTPQYAKLQEQQNITQAKIAEKSGTSAIPTIIRTQALSEGTGVIGAQGGESGIGFVKLAMEGETGKEQSLWIQSLKSNSCSKTIMDDVVAKGASLADLKEGCTCNQLITNGYTLGEIEPVCPCKELKAAGYNISQLKNAGYSAEQLRLCGFNACAVLGSGFSAQEMKDGGFSDGEMKGAGVSEEDIARAGGLPDNISAEDVRKAGCNVEAITKLRNAGVSAAAIKRISGCDLALLKAAGYSAADLKNAGYSAAELKNAGFSPAQLRAAGFNASDLRDAGFSPEELAAAGFTPEQIKQAELAFQAKGRVPNCNPESLKAARAAGVTALTIKNTLGCSAKALKDAGYTAKDLKDAGFSAAELKNPGFGAKDLKDAGFSPKELADAGFTAQELKDAGFTAKDLRDAGFSPSALKMAGFDAKALKDAGFNATDLKNAGFSPNVLKDAGFTAQELKDAGFTDQQLRAAGITPPSALAGLSDQQVIQQGSSLTGFTTLPTGIGQSRIATENAANNAQLQKILDQQNKRLAEQKYQQVITQRTSDMLSAANQSLQAWSQVDTQIYEQGSETEATLTSSSTLTSVSGTTVNAEGVQVDMKAGGTPPIMRAGDMMFAVIDTSVDSDEPSPILATVVSGKLRGAKLIGSFNLPANGDKMVIVFNTMSVPGTSGATAINAYAIDANTTRTALSSRTNHHYLMRYGSLFASSFLEGLGNAIQTAGTTITIGGTGGNTNTTVQSSRPGNVTLENAVIALSAVGKSWGQQAQQNMNRPTTVQVFSGTGIGVLFTQDLRTL
jgi:intracellular multiplication protein IcmE